MVIEKCCGLDTNVADSVADFVADFRLKCCGRCGLFYKFLLKKNNKNIGELLEWHYVYIARTLFKQVRNVRNIRFKSPQQSPQHLINKVRNIGGFNA